MFFPQQSVFYVYRSSKKNYGRSYAAQRSYGTRRATASANPINRLFTQEMLLYSLRKGVTSGVIVGGTADTRSYVSAQLPGLPFPAVHASTPTSLYIIHFSLLAAGLSDAAGSQRLGPAARHPQHAVPALPAPDPFNWPLGAPR